MFGIRVPWLDTWSTADLDLLSAGLSAAAAITGTASLAIDASGLLGGPGGLEAGDVLGWISVGLTGAAGAIDCGVLDAAISCVGDAVGVGIGSVGGLFGLGGTDEDVDYLLTAAKVGHLVASAIGVDWGWLGTAVAGGEAYRDRLER
jgi:hypothetical protein